MIRFAKKIVITLVLILLTGWLLQYTWQKHALSDKNRVLSETELEKVASFPKAQYLLGLKAWADSDVTSAATHFRNAVSQDIYYISAWLKLGEAEITLGNLEKAKQIVRFTHRLTKMVRRWKWPETLLSYELRLPQIFKFNINYMVRRNIYAKDALQLADAYNEYRTDRTLRMLNPENLPPYLQNKIHLNQLADASLVWNAITTTGNPTPEIRLQYVHFLVNNKKITSAFQIWRNYTGVDGITNSGFENPITHRGFDWRFNNDPDRNWIIERVASSTNQGEYALQITFNGKKNIAFHHLYQIVSVKPLASHTLTFMCQSEDITTDQGLFVEIYGYDQQGLNARGRMITGTHDWHAESIRFKPPANCHAVVVRLRRLPSKRFDNKIAGVLRLDTFRLNRTE